ncbi:MAG TPA: ThuA domain-containing protein [Planctomycetota bacterium]|nr:ThuA domain-containing protein [Planctomycetota bacterium]
MHRIVFALVLGGFAVAPAAEKKSVLIFGLTKGFRHGDAIVKGSPVMKEIAEGLGYEATVSEDVALLNPENVKKWNLIVFNNCTGTLFKEPEWRTAFMEHVKAGAGYMGFHAATDCFYDWPEYGEMLNGWFSGHPWSQKVRTRIEDPDHPLMKPFGKGPFEISDEIYQFKNYKRSAARVLMSIDNSSVDVTRGGRKDRDYAICWIRPWGKGRVFYNAHGHGANVFQDKAFQEHVKLAMQWAIGDLEVDTTPSKEIDRTELVAKAIETLKSARSDDERVEALGVLSWCPHKDALDLVVAQFGVNQKVAAAAAAAAQGILAEAADVPKERQIEVLKKALLLTDSRDVRKAIRTQLGKLGVTDLPISVPPGFLAHWAVAGPIPNPNKALFEKGAPPESEVDVAKGFAFDGKDYAWKKVMSDDDGLVDLNQALARSGNCIGYMYAEVTVEKEMEVEVRLGSDDGFVLWLNGTRLGGLDTSRGCQPGSDKFKATLKAGANKVLMKVLQGGGDWSGCLQLVGLKGEAIAFTVAK